MSNASRTIYDPSRKSLQEYYEDYKKANPSLEFCTIMIAGEVSADQECEFELYISKNGQVDFNNLVWMALSPNKSMKYMTQAILKPDDNIDCKIRANKDAEFIITSEITFGGV